MPSCSSRSKAEKKIGRYTFLGVRPFLRLESRGAEIKIDRDSKIVRRTGNVFQVIKELLQQHRPAAMEGLPPFTAGAVGYCAYDIVRRLENIGEHATDDLDVPRLRADVFRPRARLRSPAPPDPYRGVGGRDARSAPALRMTKP